MERSLARNGMDARADQAKRKGSPSEEKQDQQKRQKSLSDQDSEAREIRREQNGKRLSDHEKRHKSKKHRHGDRDRDYERDRHRDRRSPKSQHTSPHRHRSRRSPLAPSASHDHEAGEIGAGMQEPLDHRARARSASYGSVHANGLSRQAGGQSHGYTPRKERPEVPKDLPKRSPVGGGVMGSAMFEQVRMEAIKLQKKREEEARLLAGENQEDDMDVGLGRARGKHSPIVWNKSLQNEAGSKRVRELTAAEIAQSELEQFKRQRSDNMDADAPAAMKASPSPSGSDRGDTLTAHRSTSVENETAVVPVRSRWQQADEDELQDQAAVDEQLRTLKSREQQEELQEQLFSDGEDSDAEDLSTFQKTRPPVNMLDSSRSVHNYERLNRISEGTYGVVHRARDKVSGTVCALKQIKMAEEKDGFPLSSIREINILLSLRHKNIVDVSEVVVGQSMDDVYMVMEYMEHDLKALMNSMKNPFTIAEAKNLMKQLLEGVAYLHDNWVLHRDLKTSNILYNNRGQLKICDFGMARQYGSPLMPYTHNVVTLLYRCIELLLGQKEYSTAVDMWSLGCIMAELITKDILFKGCKELEQIDAICKIMGTPNEKDWPGLKNLPAYGQIRLPKHKPQLRRIINEACGYDTDFLLSQNGFDLLERLLCLDPSKRISAKDALEHPWFKELPLPTSDTFMPTFAESQARDGRTSRQGKGVPDVRSSMNDIFPKKL